MEANGRIDITISDTGVHTISLPSGDASVSDQTPLPQFGSSQYRRLRTEVWDAFICELPAGLRYINGTTGEVRMALEGPPDPPHEWRKIQVIDGTVQKKWATNFLVTKQCTDDPQLLKALSDSLWFVRFPTVLKDRSKGLSADWNRIRTQRTMAHVRQWCATNTCPAELLFSSGRATGRVAPAVPTSEDSPLRQTVMSAVSQMSDNKLLELCIPLKYMTGVLPKSQISNIYPKSTR